jgi:hypothetical protein
MCPIIAIIIFVHVPNCFGYVMVIIADRELWDMALPCSEACSRLSRSSRGLRNKEMSAQEGPQNGKKAPDVRGAWLEHKRLMHSHSRAPSRRTVRTGRVDVALAYDVGVTTRRKMTYLHRENLRRTRHVKPPPCVFPFDILCLRLGAPAPGEKFHQSRRTHLVCGGASAK